MTAQGQRRDPRGKLIGAERVDREGIPTVPISAVTALLADPLRRPLVCLWADPTEPTLALYIVIIEAAPGTGDAIRVSPLGQAPVTVQLARLRRHWGAALAWRCPMRGCLTPFLFTFGKPHDRLVLALACGKCLGLGYVSRGGPRLYRAVLRSLVGIHAREPLPRLPCVPTTITNDPKVLKKYVNLSLAEAPAAAAPGSGVETMP